MQIIESPAGSSKALFNSLAEHEGERPLTLIMPVHFEGVRVIPVITTLAYTVRVPLKLLVVYDTTDDPTYEVVRKMQVSFSGIALVQNRYKRAIGAIRTGFEENSSEVAGIWVSYHVDPYGLVNRMFDLARDHDCKLVSGNRFNRLKRFSRGSLMKKLLSRGGNYFLNRIIGLPIGDITTSLKLYRKDFLDSNPIETSESGGWALSTELAVKAAVGGVRLGEVEFKPENTSIITGVSNFRVFGQLDQYLKWLFYGWRNRALIADNYRNRKNYVK